MDRQLALAGLRLAKLLNGSIGKMTPKDFAALVQPNADQERSQDAERLTPAETGSAVKAWVNTKSGAYHCPDSHWYRNTKQGEYMSESEVVKNGYHRAGGKSCESSR